MLSAWLQNKTPENIVTWFSASEHFPLLATLGDEVVGVGLITSEGQVALCYVLPEARFKGIGKSLLEAMESRAMQLGITELHLNSTATGKEFYLRNGFIESGASEVELGIEAFPLVKQLSQR